MRLCWRAWIFGGRRFFSLPVFGEGWVGAFFHARRLF